MTRGTNHEPKRIMGRELGVAGHLVTRGKAGQRRIDLLNLFETFGGKLGSLGKASIGRRCDTATKKGDNGSWAIRKFRSIKSCTTVLLVIIINIAQPKSDRSNALEGLQRRRQEVLQQRRQGV